MHVPNPLVAVRSQTLPFFPSQCVGHYFVGVVLELESKINVWHLLTFTLCCLVHFSSMIEVNLVEGKINLDVLVAH